MVENEIKQERVANEEKGEEEEGFEARKKVVTRAFGSPLESLPAPPSSPLEHPGGIGVL